MKQPAALRNAMLIAGHRQLASPYVERMAASFKEQNRQKCEVTLCPAKCVAEALNCVAEAPSPSSVNACQTAGIKLGLVCFALVKSKCLNEY